MNKTILILIIIFIGSSCSEFGDINQDPNHPTSVPTSTLITSSLRSISEVIGADIGALYTQMLSETHFTEASRYSQINFDFNAWYTGPLANLQEIIRLNTDETTKGEVQISGSNANQIAVARILKAYFYHHLTDRWGPLPYSEALQGSANFKPSYDSQKSIYNNLFEELSEAVQQIQESEKAIEGDFLLHGDMQRWKQFANTLRMIMALRLSEVDENKAESEFKKAMNASGGVLTSVEDNVMYVYLAETNNQNPWYRRFLTRSDYAISEPLVNQMKATNDPRLMHYADAAPVHSESPDLAPTSPQQIIGMPYGLDVTAAADIANNDISFPNSIYIKGETSSLPIFTYAQVLFSMTEAAHRGWINDDAKTLYEQAIEASMAQWNVEMGDFINQTNVKWNNAKALRLIGEQKWLALYMQGYEAWAEWRRLDYPTLNPALSALNASGEIPRRQAYPISESEQNTTNYQNALRLLDGADDLDTRLWWNE